jgi:hypothetical protein
MNRATWREDRRMQKFGDLLRRWERGAVSMLEPLGMSERQFRRYRDRYEEDGVAGLLWYAAGLVERAKRRRAYPRKRERKPFEGMMQRLASGLA